MVKAQKGLRVLFTWALSVDQLDQIFYVVRYATQAGTVLHLEQIDLFN